MNGDGILDIVSTDLNLDQVTSGGIVRVFLGKGDGTFAKAVNYVAGNNLSSLALADFNGDGHIDIAVADVSSSNVAILLNKGDGTFAAPVNYPSGPNPYSLGTADFNGDGHADLAVTNYCDVSQEKGNCPSTQTTVAVLLGNGDGTFASPVTYQAGNGPFDLAIGDFNGDGKPDLAVTLGTLMSVSVLLNNGDGTFQSPLNYAVGAGSYLGLGDFNGDGSPGLVLPTDTGLEELQGTGKGGFYAAVNYFVQGALYGLPGVGDLNGDGRPDIVVATDVTETISVFLNAGGTSRSATAVQLTSSQNPMVLSTERRTPLIVVVARGRNWY